MKCLRVAQKKCHRRILFGAFSVCVGERANSYRPSLPREWKLEASLWRLVERWFPVKSSVRVPAGLLLPEAVPFARGPVPAALGAHGTHGGPALLRTQRCGGRERQLRLCPPQQDQQEVPQRVRGLAYFNCHTPVDAFGTHVRLAFVFGRPMPWARTVLRRSRMPLWAGEIWGTK